ncbi:hypothetical protein BROUX41_000312 [Berkeleyomyces rouxiae]|uniref:uncharacterized protein n=1 Tax=Berkeleyomyces rouxiae TaxID=2035830 RepID=UPI003B7CDB64
MPPAVAAQLLSAISMTGAQMPPQQASLKTQHAHDHQNEHQQRQPYSPSSQRRDLSAYNSSSHYNQSHSGDQPRRDMELPFGYNYDLGHDEDILNEPPPAPDGDMSLLTDEDAKLLSSFFETVETDTFGSSWGEGLAIPSDWRQFDDPAAALDSHSMLAGFQQHYSALFDGPNSLSHHRRPSSDRHYPPASQLHARSAHVPYPVTTHNGLEVPREIYEAAATLVQDAGTLQQPHGHRAQQHYARPSSVSHDSAYPPSPSPSHPTPYAYQHAAHHSHSSAHAHAHHHSQSTSGASYDHVAAATMAARASASRRSLPMNFEWGTDSSFNNADGYVPASDREASTMLAEQQQAATIDRWFTVSQSGATTAAPTRAQTPVPTAPTAEQRHSPKRSIAAATAAHPSEDTESDTETIQPPATKRRKSMHTRDASAPSTSVAPAAADNPKSSRAKNGAKPISTPSDAPSKPRKTRTSVSVSAPSAPDTTTTTTTTTPTSTSTSTTKPPRKNLTDQQKRENHIFSEQRRRTAIKVGFEELTEMVPGIKGGGFSKSAVLNISCTWLQDLLEGNERLEEQLRLYMPAAGAAGGAEG